MTLLIIELDHPHSNITVCDAHDNKIATVHLTEGLDTHNTDAWAAVRAKGPGIAQLLDALRAELIGAPSLRDEVEALQRALLDDVAKRYKRELLAQYILAAFEEMVGASLPGVGVLPGRRQRAARKQVLAWIDNTRTRRSPGARVCAFERMLEDAEIAGTHDDARAVVEASPPLTTRVLQARYCTWALRHAGKDWTRQHLAERPTGMAGGGREVAA